MTRRLVEEFVDAALDADEQGVLPEAVAELSIRLPGRLLAVIAADCNTPPDLDGLCLACGRHIAPAVAKHKVGCNPLALVATPARRLRRIATRTGRLGRLLVAACRRGSA